MEIFRRLYQKNDVVGVASHVICEMIPISVAYLKGRRLCQHKSFRLLFLGFRLTFSNARDAKSLH